MKKKTKLEWQAEQHQLERAGRLADELVDRLRLEPPIDPIEVAKSEYPLLRTGGRDLRDRYDGMLEYHKRENCFLLFYNTKYDRLCPPGEHHPRTRFSIGHELGHYFIEHHHAYLSHGGKPHPSVNEFRSTTQIEREADSFAANLLLPTRFVRPIVNKDELSLERIEEIASYFKASLVSTAIRTARLSDFPCAVAGIRDGAVAWTFPSQAIVEAGFYPSIESLPPNAKGQWAEFQVGACCRASMDGMARDWFRTFDRDDLYEICVFEEYLPIDSMRTLVVLLTIDEGDLNTASGDEWADE